MMFRFIFIFSFLMIFLVPNFAQGIVSNTKSPLFRAVEKNSKEEILQLLKAGHNIEDVDKHGNTPLLFAAKTGKWEMMYFLASEGANLKASNGLNQNALFYAAGKSDMAVDFLLRHGLNYNQVDNLGKTAFSSAFFYNMYKLQDITGLEPLICAGTDLSIKDSFGNDVYAVASVNRKSKELNNIITRAKNGKYSSSTYSIFYNDQNKSTIDEELKARAEGMKKLNNYLRQSIHRSLRSPNTEFKFQAACYGGALHHDQMRTILHDLENEHPLAEAMLFLTSYIFASTAEEKTNFINAVRKNLPDYLNLAVDGHAEALYVCGMAYALLGDHSSAITNFARASEKGSPSGMVKYASYLISGEHIKKNLGKAFELLCAASETGHRDAAFMLALCYEYGIGTEKNLKQALFWSRLAATLDHISAMKKLSEYYAQGVGVDKNDIRAAYWRDYADFLHNAKQKRVVHQKVFEARKHTCTLTKSKNLLEAISNRDAKELKLLIKRGSPLEIRNSDGETPVLFAARCGHWDFVRILLRAGADPNATCKKGITLLMWAMSGRLSYEETKLLANEVSNHKLLDNDGKSILHYAAIGYYPQKIELALKYFDNIDHQDNNGNTAFALSESKNKQFLYTLGANPFIVNKYGLDLAYKAKWYRKLTDPFDLHRFVPRSYIFSNYDTKKNSELTDKEKIFNRITKGEININVIKKFIEYGGNINERTQRGELLINIAASKYNDKERLVEFLLAKGADPNKTDFHGQTALFYAAKSGDSRIVDMLLKLGSAVSKRDIFGHTPLFYAAADRNEANIRLLLEKGADVNARSRFGETPLMWATFGDREHRHYKNANPIVRFLVQRGAEVNSISNAGMTSLWCAAYRKDFSTAKFLIESGADINVPTHHRIIDKVVGYDNNFVVYLLENGLDPEVEVKADSHWTDPRYNHNSKNPIMQKMNAPLLYWASQNGIDEAVKLILSKNININKKSENNETSLIVAIDKNHQNIIKMLINAGADITLPRSDGQTPLIRAAKKGLSKTVKMLIAAGATITTEDFDRFIARDRNVKILKKRGIYADLESVKRLSPELAEMWGVNQDGTIKEEHLRVDDLDKAASDMSAAELSTFIRGKPFTKEQLNRALHFAAERNSDPNVLKLLVEKGADVNDSDKPQLLGAPDPVIFSAVLGNKVKNVEMLITLGADIHKLDNQDEGTLLHSAAGLGYADIVKVLLQHGCDKNVEDHYGSKAIDNARENKKDEIVKLLSK